MDTNVKAKPATALPWTAGKPVTSHNAVPGQRGIWAGKRGVADVYGYPETSAYIAHAANAYPRLVEALRAMVREHPGDDAEISTQRPSVEAQALLRSLGEL